MTSAVSPLRAAPSLKGSSKDKVTRPHRPSGVRPVYAPAWDLEKVAVLSGGQEPPWLQSLRTEASRRLQVDGLPGKKVEAWRFTSVRELLSTDFSRPVRKEGPDWLRLVRDELGVPEGVRVLVHGGRLVAVDRREELSEPVQGIRIYTIEDAIRHGIESLPFHLGQVASSSYFAALNLSSFEEGLVLEVDPGARVEVPIEIVHLGMSGSLCHRRLFAVIGEGSSAQVVERELQLEAKDDTKASCTNEVSEWVLGSGAELFHTRILSASPKDYHLASVGLKQAERSRFVSNVAFLGSPLQRVELQVDLQGEHAYSSVSGAQVAGPKELVDAHVFLRHSASNTESHQCFRSIAAGQGTVVYDGISKVEHGTAKVEAHQSSKTVLLDEDAAVHTKPHLEIDADEVSCSHGATVGALDEEALFYLRARGVGEREAYEMLLQGFVQEVLPSTVSETLRASLEESLLLRLSQIIRNSDAPKGQGRGVEQRESCMSQVSLRVHARKATPVIASYESFDVDEVRAQFPALETLVYEKSLVYLDSAATALKPRSVIDAAKRMYEEDCANVHRGIYQTSQRATEAFEAVRDRVARFLKAKEREEIVFVRGATEGINLVAQCFVKDRLEEGDEVLVTELEHHANIVPWQMICQEKGANLKVVPIEDSGEVSLESFSCALSSRTKFAAFAHASNVLGTVLPVASMVALAREKGVPTLVDGAQAVPHMPVDVNALGADFYVFSAHKLYGPTGTGVLYGRRALLESMPPYQGGGEMIREVSFSGTSYNDVPLRFEAGTPNIAGVVGMGAAIDFVDAIGFDALVAHEERLRKHAEEVLRSVEGLQLWSQAPQRIGALSFTLQGVHPSDLGTLLDRQGIAIRTGHHCAQPLMERLGVSSTARLSLGMYNSLGDIDRFGEALAFAKELCA